MDPKRVNEYGTTGEDHQGAGGDDANPPPAQLQGGEEINSTDPQLANGPVGNEEGGPVKPLAEKKDD